MRSWTAAIAVSVVAACTSHRAWPCLQDDITIKQGVIGSIGSCLHGCASQPQPIAGSDVEIYAVAPAGDPVPTGAPIATTKTNADGFFEIAADPGSYDLCWLSSVCTTITVSAGTTIHLDIVEGDLVADHWQSSSCP